MAEISKATQVRYGKLADIVPYPLRKSLPQSEFLDRLAYVETLQVKAMREPDGEIAARYNKLARQVMYARPRADVAQEAAGLRKKAVAMGRGLPAETVLKRAEDLIKDNPPAPRRDATIRKADAKNMMPVYSAAGELLGVCDPLKVSRLAPPPQPSAGDDQAAAGDQRNLGTAKVPASAETPAAGTPDDVAKQRQLRGVFVNRRP